jgi:hypothetical protein
VSAQLELFAETLAAPRGRLTREQAGLAHGIPPGPERLLAALVKRGVAGDDLRVAAALCLALENVAEGEGES